jgi:hypothetical protein
MKTKLMVRGTLAGVFVIMLSLVLIISALPVQAVPQPGHHFYGNVIGATPGTVISAQIGGVEYATTTVDDQGRYGYDPPFVVPSDDKDTRSVKEGGSKGDTVELYVLGELAGEAPFKVWGITKLNLLLREMELTVASGGNGSTDPSGTDSYPYNTVVEITATPATDCEFDYWLVNNVKSGSANPISITMDGDYNVVANFAPIDTDNGDDGGNGDDGDNGDDNGDNGDNGNGDGDNGGYGDNGGDGDGNNSDNGTGDDSNDTSSSEGSLVAIVFIPGSQADLGAALARIACGLETCSGGVQKIYLYDPNDANGPWVEQYITCSTE